MALLEQMPKGVRSHAVSALIEVLRRKKKPKEVLDAALSAVTERRDRAFVSELVYGVLRHKRYLDWVLGQFLRNPDRLAPGTMVDHVPLKGLCGIFC